MLRSVKSTVQGLKLIGFCATTAASAANTVAFGKGDGTFTNATADNQIDFVPKVGFARTPVVVGTAGDNIAVGGTAFVAADPSATSVSLTTVNGSNAADVGSVCGLIVAPTSRTLNTLARKDNGLFTVFSTKKAPRIIAAQITTGGSTVTVGKNQVTNVTGGTGISTITFKNAFASPPVVIGTPEIATEGGNCRIDSITASTCVVNTFNAANTATSMPINLLIYGSDVRDSDSHSIVGRAVQTQMRLPRLIAAHISYSAGTPSFVVGGGELTVADTGTGAPTLTFRDAFPTAKVPVVVASSSDATNRWCTVVTSATGVAIEVTGSTGTPGDPTDVHVIILGSDDPTEF